jgi:hypothetical protein
VGSPPIVLPAVRRLRLRVAGEGVVEREQLADLAALAALRQASAMKPSAQAWER